MAVGDVVSVDGCPDIHYVDTGMYETASYGAVYIVDAARPAVVDTGIGTHVDRVLEALRTVGIEQESLEAIVPTHVHLDHAGGAGFLAEACPNASVYVHEIGAPHLIDPARLVEGTKRAVGDQWQYYVEPEPVPSDRVVELTDGDTVPLGDRQLRAHHAPGHAPHQVVLAEDRSDAVFTADAAGIWVPALDRVRETTPPPNFDLEQCLADVEMIRDLDPDQLLYPHFGPAPRRALEAYPGVLESWVDTVREAVEREGGVDAAAERLAREADIVEVWGQTKAHGEVAMNVRGVAHALGLD
jgi:glyoxylase-like metal-dependent hydrolase (beta-lactamase superfamily II)